MEHVGKNEWTLIYYLESYPEIVNTASFIVELLVPYDFENSLP